LYTAGLACLFVAARIDALPFSRKGRTIVWRCPICRSKIRIIDACADIVIHDDGVEQVSDFEWGDDSPAECTNCDWKGPAEDAFIEETA